MRSRRGRSSSGAGRRRPLLAAQSTSGGQTCVRASTRSLPHRRRIALPPPKDQWIPDDCLCSPAVTALRPEARNSILSDYRIRVNTSLSLQPPENSVTISDRTMTETTPTTARTLGDYSCVINAGPSSLLASSTLRIATPSEGGIMADLPSETTFPGNLPPGLRASGGRSRRDT